jgi:hypothetical protein
VLAERGSGLALWYDTLDNLSAYAAQAGDNNDGNDLLQINHTFFILCGGPKK